MSALSQPTALEDILARVPEVAVLPQVVYKVIEVTGSADAAAGDIARIVAVDPGFCARLLQLVNSAYYCLPRQVGSVKEAVMFIGIRALRQLATTIGMFDLFMGKADKASLRKRLWWRHSLDSAVTCRQMAKRAAQVSEEEAYAAALLHDIGKSVLDRSGSGGYDRVEELVEAGTPILDAEKRVFGHNHCDVGFAVTSHWRFPHGLVECAGFHHVPGPDMEHPRLCASVATASAFADLRDAGGETPAHEVVPPWAAAILGMTEDDADDAYVVCCAAIDESSALTGVL